MPTEVVMGRVERLTSLDSVLHADVTIDAAGGCARCRSGRGCGAGVFTGAGGQRTIRLPVPAGASIDVGTDVTVRIPGKSLVAAALVAYGLPLAGLLAGGLAGFTFGGGDAVTALAAGVGLIAAAGVARARARRECRYAGVDSLLLLEPGRP